MTANRQNESMITAAWVRENLIYEEDVGVFLWKRRGPGRMMGRVLGTKVWPGYIAMKLNNLRFYAHRVAWLYVHGEWPAGQIDHIDGDKGNNAISNLRVATPSQNSAGKRTTRRVATSRGVMPHGVGFVARLYHGGKRHYLGYFPTAELARAAYEAKAIEIHGEFAHEERLSPFDTEVAEAMKRSPHRDWLPVTTLGFGV
jgi:hypothetical protein